MAAITNPENDMGALLAQSEAVAQPERGDLLTGTLVSVDDQGLIIDLGLKRDGVVPRADFEKLKDEGVEFTPGEKLTVMVITPEDKDGNLVVSVFQARQNQDWVLAEEYLSDGKIYEGTVSGYNRGGLIVPFGDLRGFVPASHVTELPRNLSEDERQSRMASLVGRQFGFKVVEVDRQRRRLVLSQRDAQREWRDQRKARLLDDLAEGQIRQGVVTGLRDFGAFVDLGGADGLIHVSELAWHRVKHPREVLSVGQEVEAKVVKIDHEAKRIGLSLKALQPDPWTRVAERFEPGQTVSGTVTRMTTFGAFVDLGEGIEGLLHSSQMPPDADVREGEPVTVRVVNVEPGRQRIGLTLMGIAPESEEPAEGELE